MGEYFGDVLKRALSRREVLKSAIFGSAGLALVACGGVVAPWRRQPNHP